MGWWKRLIDMIVSPWQKVVELLIPQQIGESKTEIRSREKNHSLLCQAVQILGSHRLSFSVKEDKNMDRVRCIISITYFAHIFYSSSSADSYEHQAGEPRVTPTPVPQKKELTLIREIRLGTKSSCCLQQPPYPNQIIKLTTMQPFFKDCQLLAQ